MTTANPTPTDTYKDIAKDMKSKDAAKKAEAVAAKQKAPDLSMNDVDKIAE